MGNKLVSFATSESHPPLANALNKLGRAWHTISDLDGSEAISECVIIGDSLGYQGVNSKSAKETLQQRTAVLEEYQAAVKTSISKRRQIERLKSSSSISQRLHQISTDKTLNSPQHLRGKKPSAETHYAPYELKTREDGTVTAGTLHALVEKLTSDLESE